MCHFPQLHFYPLAYFYIYHRGWVNWMATNGLKYYFFLINFAIVIFIEWMQYQKRSVTIWLIYIKHTHAHTRAHACTHMHAHKRTPSLVTDTKPFVFLRLESVEIWSLLRLPVFPAFLTLFIYPTIVNFSSVILLQPVYLHTIHLHKRETPCSKESVYRNFWGMERKGWSTYIFCVSVQNDQLICFKVISALTVNPDRKCLIFTDLLKKGICFSLLITSSILG